eukprot:5251902-Lingulodinium_polyedra.AAC.1
MEKLFAHGSRFMVGSTVQLLAAKTWSLGRECKQGITSLEMKAWADGAQALNCLVLGCKCGTGPNLVPTRDSIAHFLQLMLEQWGQGPAQSSESWLECGIGRPRVLLARGSGAGAPGAPRWRAIYRGNSTDGAVAL